MQPCSERFDKQIVRSRIGGLQANLIEDGKVVAELPVTGGSGVTEDRNASNLRTAEIEFPDPKHQIDVAALPLGTLLQILSGVWLPNVVFHTAEHKDAASWQVSNLPGSPGVMCSVTVDEDGALTLFGP